MRKIDTETARYRGALENARFRIHLVLRFRDRVDYWAELEDLRAEIDATLAEPNRDARIARLEDRLSPADIKTLLTEGLISLAIAFRALAGDREALRVAAEAALDHDRLDP